PVLAVDDPMGRPHVGSGRAQRMKCHQPEVAAPGPVRTYPRRQREVDLTGTGSLEELLEPRQPSPELVQVLAAQVVADYRAPAEDVDTPPRAVGHHQPELRQAAVVAHHLVA